MFFFSPEEAEDYRRDKRRRLLTQNHEERLKAIQQTEGEVVEDVWGDSDEEPDDQQKELMRRTATHLISSPNPAQLEMRILANHGADKRFSFLRGRWSRFWKSTKAHLKQEKEGAGLGDLAGYGSGESDSEEHATKVEIANDDERATMENKRARLKQWSENRRAAAIAENVDTI